jgi:kynurenine--oxoglutarate transaminase/cysteine-S-conjugate beta-lyase/glutamine--phenylpyruvate transaminase
MKRFVKAVSVSVTRTSSILTPNHSRAMSSSKSTTPPSAFQLATRLDGLDKPTVWHEFSPLANEYSAVNLGQGFPDWDPPPFATAAMNQAIDPSFGRNANQYARSYAHMPLAQVLAEDYSKWLGRSIDPATEVATAVGCTNALYCALTGLISPGDEVLLLEPAFDVYIAQAKMAGGVCKFVPLRSNPKKEEIKAAKKDGEPLTANEAFILDMDELEAKITERTKVFILNSPQNPTGKMFSLEELTQIAQIMKRHPQITVISDEVYQHIVFDELESPHIPFATIPDMYDRTLTLASSGKTFSATGWKVGWAVGPPHLVHAVSSVQQWVNFSAPTPNQDAIALALIQAREPYKGFDSYYKWLAGEYKRKRGILCDAIQAAGMDPILPNGAFYIMTDTSAVDLPQEFLDEKTVAMPTDPMPRDWAMSRFMTKRVGVTAIPPSAFYDIPNVPLAKDLLRFAFCKGDDTLIEAGRRFHKFFETDDEKKKEEE